MPNLSRLPGARSEHWEWQLQAACRGLGSEVFFHPDGERDPARAERVAAAKRVCAQCPVVLACAAHALRVREPYGVWGGLAEDERATRRRRLSC